MPEILDGRFVLQDLAPRSGGSAVVKKATDINNGGFVAVKFLVDGKDSVLRRLFKRESELLRGTKHPNIVKFVDAGVDESDTPYVVLAWVDDNLNDVFDRTEPLAWGEFVPRIIRPLADAVAYLHQQGIEHRDIKTINVLADDKESPLLADFGIAKQHDESSSTQTVSNFGTYLWTPPEGAEAEAYMRDVFALGVMCIYGMLRKDERPRTYDELDAKLASLGLPDDLNELIGLSISRDPGRRPRNALEFIRRLDRAVAAQQPNAPKTRVYVGLTNAARRQLVGESGISDQADGVLLDDLRGDVWVSARWDNDLSQYDPTVIFLTGTELRITAKRDVGQSWFSVTGVTRPNYEDLERARDRGMRVSEFISWTTQRPLDSSAVAGAYELLLERVIEFSTQRDAEASGQQGVSQIVGAWRRLLDAREALLSEEAEELEFVKYEHRSDRETKFTLVEEPETDLIGTEWLILDEVRNRPIMQGTVVHQTDTGLSIQWTWRRSKKTKIPAKNRLRPYLGPNASALVRQRSALQLLESGSSAISELPRLLEEPGEAQPPRPPQHVDWKSDLDPSKQEAVKAALGLDDVMVVTGPPGTGKTRFIAETVYQFLRSNPEAQVLIVSQTHVAVDNAIERLLSSGINEIVRIGGSDDARISDSSRKLLLENKVTGWAKEIRQRSEQQFEKRAEKAGVDKDHLRAILLLEEYDARRRQIAEIERTLEAADSQGETASRLDLLDEPGELRRKLRSMREHQRETLVAFHKAVSGSLSLGERPSQNDVRAAVDLLLNQSPASKALSSLMRLQGEWLQRLEVDNAIASLYLQSSRVIAGTCLGFLSHPAVRDVQFDLCIIDEASKATSTEALVPAVRSRRIVMVGDANQLPPVDEDLIHRRDLLESFELNPDFVKQTLFSRLVENLPDANRFALHEQYRMVAPIGNLVSECFYEGRLRSPNEAGVRGYEHLGKTVCWLDTSSNDRRFEARDTYYAGSFVNRCEADVAMQRLASIESGLETGLIEPKANGEPYEVLLIAPYRGQIDELKRRLDRQSVSHLRVEVESVDAVQGREADFVIFSVTRSNKERRFGFLGQDYWRRINVALSRARFGLTIVGDAVFSSDERGALSRVLTYMRQHPDECEIRGDYVSN